MTVTHRRKLAIILLAAYWPALFIITHIAIPEKVRAAGVSDKVLHFLAYLILAFLFWIALNGDRKVCWRKAASWAALLTMIVYGVIDELVQGYVGRSCDRMDLAADSAGVFAGLILLTFLTARTVAVIICGAIIFGMTNIARVKPADYVPVVNAIFHLFSYAGFTVLWIRCLQFFDSLGARKLRWLAAAVALPMALLFLVKGYSLSVGKEFPVQDIVLSVGGIAAVVGVVSATVLFRRSTAQGPSASDD